MAINQESTIRRRVVVIGAGQAGLSAAYHLSRNGLVAGSDFDVLDANPTPGGAWSHRWDALTFDDAHGLHPLPASTLAAPDPAEPAREVVKRYYGQYEDEHGFAVERPWRVTQVRRDDDGLFVVEAEDPAGARREYRADAVISATGTWDRPFIPYYPGRFGGRQLTTRDFTDPDEFRGRRVLVVGGGTSAVQFVLLLNRHGASTVWSTRRAPQWVERPFDENWGAEVERGVAARTRRGLQPLSVVAATGLPLIPRYAEAIESGLLVSRGPIERLTETGVDFADGSRADVDVILWATGFRASLDHLAPLHLREPGGGVLMADDDVSVVKAPGLFLVGYGRSASTLGATRAGRAAARAVREYAA
ncbi:flavin-containing monooxygenase [Gordonia crocea]|uniref:Oxidoreductase n=1 Tax=Gordonia crocea TaxID=589162 RepID=A0A7I9UZE8_9ACTN|nr:NAD(P)/FAD-dependent oxidoreductase [Gordonia crocea]GED98495.1 oxidoreductase [Gordonia crocea]